ncbi:MAG: DUF4363 family protein [Oscillospiraceae bacterium]|jgi:hypothetical protein|nr:DUF4363 family protein [Oscillospiraceae bacterium]
MERIKTAWIITFLTICLCFVAVFSVKIITSGLDTDLREIERNIKSDQLPEALKKTEDLAQKWQKEETFLSMFMDHLKIESVDQAIVALKINLEQQRVEDALVEIGKASKLFDHISDTETPSFGNIL